MYKMKQIHKYIIAGLALLAIAPGLSAQENQTDDGLIHSKKTVEQNTDGSYTVTLESWTTGDQSIRPNDIVLVLDVSGSMKDPVYTPTEQKAWSYNDIKQSTTYYYIKYTYEYGGTTLTAFGRVYAYDRGRGYNERYRLYYERNDLYSQNYYDVDDVEIGRSNSNSTAILKDVLYTASSDDKMTQLKDAVEDFITDVKEKEEGLGIPSGKGSRIAIVKFAGHEEGGTNINYYTDESQTTHSGIGVHITTNGTNYNEVVRGLTSVATGSQDLIDAVQGKNNESYPGLRAGGATAADRGMHLAANIIAAANKETNRKSNKIVVMFTDGEPNHARGFSTSVAGSAITQAKVIKDAGGVVFTIGVFAEETNEIKKYMEWTSSDYPEAASWSDAGSNGRDGQGYYILVSPTMSIADAFDQALNSVNSSLDSEAIVKDNMTNSFKLPEGATAANINVYSVDWVDPGKWKTDADGNEARVELSVKSETNPDGMIEITVKHKGEDGAEHDGIEVTGFSYVDNWCGKRTDIHDGTVTTRIDGKKLVIEFIIDIDEEIAVGGPAVATNMGNSGIYENEDEVEPILPFEIPRTRIPVNIHIQKYGLAKGNSATFLIERVQARVDGGEVYIDPESNQPVPATGSDYEPFMTVFIQKTGDNDPADRWVRGLDPQYLYRVSEDNWSWTYTISGRVYETAAQPDNPFGFTNNPGGDTPKNAESTIVNELKYTTEKESK